MINRLPKEKQRKHNKRNKVKSADTCQWDLIFGLHPVQAALAPAVTRVAALWLAEGRDDSRITALIAAAKEHNIDPQRVRRSILDGMLPDVSHQGVIARCCSLPCLNETDLFRLLADMAVLPLLLILDGLQDPHNVGACLRTAEAAGVHAVIAPKDRTSGKTHTVLKVASGAAERLPFIQVTNLARVLRQLREQGMWIVGTSGHGETSLFDADLTGALAIVLGAEGRGMRRLTKEHCDKIVAIPMHGYAGSLNVSVASGVCLFEAMRQRSLSLNGK